MEEKRFKFETLDDIDEECRRRNLSINFAKNIDILYDTLELGNRTLGNRLAILPMEGSDADANGKPGELTFRRWKRFGSGGAKLIWGEAAAVVPEGRSNPRQLMVSEDNAAELAALVKETRKAHREKFDTDADLLIGIQLTHAGRQSFEKPLIAFHSPIHDAFTLLDKRARVPLPADYPVVSDDYLEQLEERFADAARVARDCGFDFVDVKQCHGYLLHELLAARERAGKYGGSFQNRRKFARNVVKRIRDAVGNDILIASRLNVFDDVPHVKNPETGVGEPVEYKTPYTWGWGVDKHNPHRENLTEPKRLVDMLTGVGLNFVGVTAGVPYWNSHIGRPFDRPVQGGYLSPEHPLVGVDRLFRLTAEMQRAFPEVPVVGVGYSWLRQFLLNAGAANIALGRVSIVGVGRTAFSCPDFAADGKEHGVLDPKKMCMADSMCSDMLRGWGKDGEKSPVGCPVRNTEYKTLYRKLE